MAQIVFNSDGEYSRGSGSRNFSRGGMAGWLKRVSGGIIPTEQAANWVLFFIAVVIFAIAALILFRSL